MKGSIMLAAALGGCLLAQSARAQAPQVTSFYPTSGTVGTQVHILGSNLATVTQVTFATFDLVFPASIMVESDQEIVATVPYAAAPGNFTVQTATGTATSPAPFTVVPQVIGRTTMSGSPNVQGLGTISVLGGSHNVTYFDVTVTGGKPNDFILFGAYSGDCAHTTFYDLSLGSLMLDATGSGTLHVAQRLLGVQLSALFSSPHVICGSGAFTCTLCGPLVAVASPSLMGFSPSAGSPGSVVVLTGANFDDVNSVTLAGIPADFTPRSSTQIEAVVPAGVSGGYWGVAAPNGVSYSGTRFTVQGPTASRRTSWGRLKAAYR